MPDESKRKLAADARAVLKAAEDRGIETGEALGYEKGLAASARQALLEMHAAGLKAAAALVGDETAETAFNEASGILTDLADQGAEGVGRRVNRRGVSAASG